MDSVKLGGGLTSTAIRAALERRNESLQAMRDRIGAIAPTPAPVAGEESGFGKALLDGIRSTDQKVREVDELPLKVIRGELELHEAAAQIQSSRIAFEFSMEVRNKLIEAYREIMRMSV